jgi:hypothetical protein
MCHLPGRFWTASLHFRTVPAGQLLEGNAFRFRQLEETIDQVIEAVAAGP